MRHRNFNFFLSFKTFPESTSLLATDLFLCWVEVGRKFVHACMQFIRNKI